jgi:hypothetical protein
MAMESPETDDPEHCVKWKKEDGRWKVVEAQCGAFSIQNQ